MSDLPSFIVDTSNVFFARCCHKLQQTSYNGNVGSAAIKAPTKNINNPKIYSFFEQQLITAVQMSSQVILFD